MNKLFFACALAALVACKPVPGAREMRGVALPEPIARPSFVLEDVAGKPFDFKQRTAGRLTFLMFGYTNCPDVCPIHMNSLSKALQDVPYEDRAKIDVIFVSTDPERDTPQKLRDWLAQADPKFIGLRGSNSTVVDAQRQLNIAPAVKSEPDANGSYTVGHASQVYVFTPDDSARRVYPFGTRQSDWMHDIPILIESFK